MTEFSPSTSEQAKIAQYSKHVFIKGTYMTPCLRQTTQVLHIAHCVLATGWSGHRD